MLYRVFCVIVLIITAKSRHSQLKQIQAWEFVVFMWSRFISGAIDFMHNKSKHLIPIMKKKTEKLQGELWQG